MLQTELLTTDSVFDACDLVFEIIEWDVLDVDSDVESWRRVIILPQTTVKSSFRKRLPLTQYNRKLMEEFMMMPSLAMANASLTILLFP